MALQIGDDCIQCAVCITQCANGAIFEADDAYRIDPGLCTECVGYYEEAQCQEGCPVGAIMTHPEHRESREQLESKYRAIAGPAGQ